MIRNLSLLVVVAAIGALVATPAYAPPNNKGGGGSAASSKAVFSKNVAGVTILDFLHPTLDPATENCSTDGPTGFDPPNAVCTVWHDLFILTDALKTSSVGALEAVLSMECALWTNTEVTAPVAGGIKTSGARAGIEVRVTIDSGVMEPGIVVYCDRLQYIEFTPPSGAGTTTGSFVFRLFQRTKNSHAYHFYKPMENVELHDILVEVRGIVRCFKDGAFVACEEGLVDNIAGTIFGGTKAVIGKSTLVVEEHQNWRILDDGVGQCADGIDNDGDNLIDLADGDCADSADNDESA